MINYVSWLQFCFGGTWLGIIYWCCNLSTLICMFKVSSSGTKYAHFVRVFMCSMLVSCIYWYGEKLNLISLFRYMHRFADMYRYPDKHNGRQQLILCWINVADELLSDFGLLMLGHSRLIKGILKGLQIFGFQYMYKSSNYLSV